MTLIPVLTDYEKTHISERQPLPERYVGLSDDEMDRRIAAAKAALGTRLVILGHHYQRDEVIKFADYIGDSYKLSQQVSKHPAAEFIVFCGVHFMAESADVLSAPYQQVILPDLAAGCSMADMADPEQLQMCWDDLRQMGIIAAETGPAEAGPHDASGSGPAKAGPHDASGDARAADESVVGSGFSRTSVIPVTYINSSAAIKAFVGEHGGVVCTSSNAAATLTWAWARGEKILFLPDQHLGRNTAYKMGVPLDEMVVWDPNEPWGGLTPEEVQRARIILWKGHCSVHVRFTVRQIEQLRAQHPGLRVIVHPEVPWEVVQASDDSGSTEYIIRTVKSSPPGSIWAVGTEVHLVNRLASEVAPERTVLSLDQFGCLCSTMFRVSPNHLLWVLEGLLAGEVHNRIVVPDEQKHWNRVALDRMLSIR
ncbi:MAG TPA: quinolinate synthase [Vicinamibacterales bacterium]|nr:quinolinate synthase [Vicinamibacterales bacterium]